MKHPSDDQLAAYEAGNGDCTDDPIGMHLRVCADCAAIVDFQHGLRHADVWDLVAILEREPELPQIAAMKVQVSDEDAAAESLLAPVLKNTLRFVYADITNKDQFYNGGVVRRLCATAMEMLERQPLHALEFAVAAATIADALPDDYYPSRAVFGLRGRAWKARANALRYLNRYGEALAALDEAERRFKEITINELEIATVRYVRASVLASGHRFTEALVEVRGAADVFRSYENEQREVDAKMLEGTIHYFSENYGEARAIFETILAYANVRENRLLEARARHNLALAAIGEEDFKSARTGLVQAQECYAELGLHTEHLRVTWALGRIEREEGNTARAKADFEKARQGFEQLSMLVDAALVELDYIGLLLGDHNVRDIRARSERLVRVFKAAGMYTSALTAVSYLNDVAHSPSGVTAWLLGRIRAFLMELQRDPQLLFVPPAMST
ncbi:MAG TPA: hypothetical protein VGF69_23435 [Thermoanaerobaculia bacterium]|jgi:tetratricopeptide (TPR) repeat protein